MGQLAAEHEKLLILDFGSQYTQLIARRVRELGVYCEVKPYHSGVPTNEEWKAVILSGSPCSVHDPKAPSLDLDALLAHYPVLGICYGEALCVRKSVNTGVQLYKISKAVLFLQASHVG